MNIRPATDDDVADIGRIFDRSAEWLTEHYRPDQVGHPPMGGENRERLYRHLLETGGVFIAENPGPVGFSAAIVRDGVWFLSLLWVLPENHGGGAGSGLLDEALAWGRAAKTFSVVASPYPVAQLIYLRSSMYPLWVQMDLSGDGPRPEMPRGVELLETADQSWVDDLDRTVRGIARPEDHAFWQEVARGLALRRDGASIGYIYVWPDGKIGPGAAHDPTDMPVLLEAGLAEVPADGHRSVAVPSANWTALRELVRAGFKPIGSNTFMASRPLGDPSRYISSGGALG